MKKDIIFATIATLLISASCTQQEDYHLENGAKTFIATIEQTQTRTILVNEVDVDWIIGDRININGAIYSAFSTSKTHGVAEFRYVSGDAPKEGPYKAVYPASVYNEQLQGLFFPQIQMYEQDRLNVPMIAENDTEHLTFSNICGVICFALKSSTGNVKVRGIQVTNDEEIPLWGPVTVDWSNATAQISVNEQEKPKLMKAQSNRNTITLDCGEEGVQLNNTNSTNFYIYLPATAFNAEKLHIHIIGMEGIEKQDYELVASNQVTIERNNIYTLKIDVPDFPEQEDPQELSPVLPGVFTVNDKGMKVQFSRGNLQATQSGSTWTWNFAPQQYSCIGDKNINGSDFASTIDLFGWSTTAADNNYGIFTATESTIGGPQYFVENNTFKDWGTDVQIEDRKWLTLSNEEWTYLLNTRDMGGAMSWSKTRINGICGLLLFPDNFLNNDVYTTFKNEMPSDYFNQNSFPTDNLPASYWQVLQNAGCVFLPCAGYRDGTAVTMYDNNKNEIGSYWSYTINVYSGDALNFGSDNAGVVTNPGNYTGRSVRLVTEVSSN